MNAMRIVVFKDASFTNTPELRWQLGFIVTMTDEKGQCNIMY